MKILYQLTSPMQKTMGAAEVARRRDVLQRHAGTDTEVEVHGIAHGPGSIESAYDAALVVPELLRAAPAAERDGFDAMIVGCFSDPGLDALRETVDMPVIGPGASYALPTLENLTEHEDRQIAERAKAALKRIRK